MQIDRLAITYNLAAGGVQELANGGTGGGADEIIVNSEMLRTRYLALMLALIFPF